MSEFGAFCLGLILSAGSGIYLFYNAVGKGAQAFADNLLMREDMLNVIIEELRRRGYSVMKMGYQASPRVPPPCSHELCNLVADGYCRLTE